MLISAGAVRQFFDRFAGRARAAPAVPPGLRLYVIGDIHGRADLLAQLQEMIQADADDLPPSVTRRVVYLGDYVDRGLDSCEVIERLLSDPPQGFERVHLKGNHEDALLRFLADPKAGPGWFAIGGDATVMSYGVRLDADLPTAERFTHVREELLRLMPAEHRSFLATLALTHQAGDYFLVHAGVRPGVALDAQSPQDLMWIREDFLRSSADHGKVVVHGHSPREAPEVRSNRIGLDTTAFATNVLTCLVLDGTEQRFLSTG